VNWIDEIASDSVLQQAYAWLCERRQDYSTNDDVWDIRWRWEEFRPQLQAQLRAGVYRFSPVRRLHLGNEDIASGAGFGGLRADSGSAENDWLGLIGGCSDLSLADCGYAPVVAVRRALRLCPMTWTQPHTAPNPTMFSEEGSGTATGDGDANSHADDPGSSVRVVYEPGLLSSGAAKLMFVVDAVSQTWPPGL